MRRATISEVPPGTKGTIKRIGFCGHAVCAKAVDMPLKDVANSELFNMVRRRLFIILAKWIKQCHDKIRHLLEYSDRR